MTRKTNPVPTFQLKDYKPIPHPMQHRISEFRVIPSLVTGAKRESKD